MADGTPNWLIGRSVTSLVVRVADIDSLGQLTLRGTGTDSDTATLVAASPLAATYYGLVDSIDLNCTRTTENVSSMHQRNAHFVSLTRKDSLTLSEVLRAGAAGNCLLANIWRTGSTSRYVFITFLRGANTWSGYFLMNGYSESLRRGKSIGTMSLTGVDPGSENTLYT